MGQCVSRHIFATSPELRVKQNHHFCSKVQFETALGPAYPLSKRRSMHCLAVGQRRDNFSPH